MDKKFDPDKLLFEYKSKYKTNINCKKIKYIQTLYNSISDKQIKDFYLDKLNNINKLDQDEVFKLIENLKKDSPINGIQLIQILNIFDEDDIETLLKKSFDDLTFKDAELLLNSPDKFMPWIKEHPIITEDEWEYGWQESDQFKDGKMFYLKFYNMMMLDLDQKNIPVKELIETLKQYRQFRFRLYETYNGYHIFITSELINYRDELIFKFTKKLKADIYYALFVNKTGFKVRLTPKKDRNETFVSKFIADIGKTKINSTCEKLIMIHDKSFNQEK